MNKPPCYRCQLRKVDKNCIGCTHCQSRWIWNEAQSRDLDLYIEPPFFDDVERASTILNAFCSVGKCKKAPYHKIYDEYPVCSYHYLLRQRLQSLNYELSTFDDYLIAVETQEKIDLYAKNGEG